MKGCWLILLLQLNLLVELSVGFSLVSLTNTKRQSTRINAKYDAIVRVIQPRSQRNKQCIACSAVSNLGEISLIHRFLQNDVMDSLFPKTGLTPFSHSLILNALLFIIFQKKLLSALTLSGYLHAIILGTILWTTSGWKGWSVCVLYLVMGQMVTKVKFAEKSRRGIAESRGGRRGPENVWGSAATGAICTILSVQSNPAFGISSNLYILAYVASLATKLADTFASEIGKAFGKTTFLITNMKRVEPGTEGAVSSEGTMAALFGGFILSFYGLGIGMITSLSAMVLSTLAAFIATNIESVLGATLQQKDGGTWISNEVINFLNTLIGASIAVVGGKVLGL